MNLLFLLGLGLYLGRDRLALVVNSCLMLTDIWSIERLSKFSIMRAIELLSRLDTKSGALAESQKTLSFLAGDWIVVSFFYIGATVIRAEAPFDAAVFV